MKLRELLEVLVFHQDITIKRNGIELYKGLVVGVIFDNSIELYLDTKILLVVTTKLYQIDITLCS